MVVLRDTSSKSGHTNKSEIKHRLRLSGLMVYGDSRVSTLLDVISRTTLLCVFIHALLLTVLLFMT